MTDNKHESEEAAEDTAARVEADTGAHTAVEPPGKHAAAETETLETEEASEASKPKRQTDWSRVVAFAVLPALAFVLALGAAVLKFVDSAVRESNVARGQAVQAAKDTTVALLSYKPDTVEQQLTAARDRLTGDFRDEYTTLTDNVVIPTAKKQQVSAVANVPEAASVSADPGRAVILLFINQTVTVGAGVPSDTASSVRVTLDKVGDRWLISQFVPV